tara:strand:- start:25234 stop:25845 length:612 start_codon:yes stop_codon:yes gene_type:complete
MKKQFILGVLIIAFIAVAVLISQGFIDLGDDSTLSDAGVEITWGNNAQNPAEGLVETEPSSENVSQSYFDKVEQLESFLATHPDDTTHMIRLARLYQEGHQSVKASEWYEKYKAANPNNIQVLLDLANTYGESGNWDKALSVTNELLELDENNDKALYNKAAILANRNELDEAKQLWQQIMANSEDAHIRSLSQSALNKLKNM